MATGVDDIAGIDNAQVSLLEIIPDALAVVPHLRQQQVRGIGATLNHTKMSTLPQPGYAPTEAKITFLAGVGVRVCGCGGSCWGASWIR